MRKRLTGPAIGAILFYVGLFILQACLPLTSIVVVHYKELAHSANYYPGGSLPPPIYPDMFRVYEIVSVENQAVSANDFTFTLQKVFARKQNKAAYGSVLDPTQLNPKADPEFISLLTNPDTPAGQVFVAAGHQVKVSWKILVRTTGDLPPDSPDSAKETLADLGYVLDKNTSVLMTRDTSPDDAKTRWTDFLTATDLKN